MSPHLVLFHYIPAVAIERLYDEQYQLLFKRADLGKDICIVHVACNFKELITRLRQKIFIRYVNRWKKINTICLLHSTEQ